MLEFPEAKVTAGQINRTLKGKRIAAVTANQSPHKLAWYNGDPQDYPGLLVGKSVEGAEGRGGMVEVRAGDAVLLFSDGVNLRFHGEKETRPPKHQLLIEFADSTVLSASVQMYGGIICFKGTYDNQYYKAAVEKPAPLSPGFDRAYFGRLISDPETQKLSLKAFLATEQRIPGLGNGVLQDILFNAGMHPRKKISTLSDAERETLFRAVTTTLSAMVELGGRDTDRDLFGQPGGYITKLSKNTAGKPCSVCGNGINKEAYMGGSIYYCSHCQKV